MEWEEEAMKIKMMFNQVQKEEVAKTDQVPETVEKYHYWEGYWRTEWDMKWLLLFWNWAAKKKKESWVRNSFGQV